MTIKRKLPGFVGAMLSLVAALFHANADQIVMQNGDQYHGKIVSVSSTNVVLESDVLGRVNLPRSKMANVAMESNATTNVIQATSPAPASNQAKSTARTNVVPELSAAVRQLGTHSNLVRQVQAQFLAGAGPEANEKFSQMLNDLTTGKMSVAGLQAEAKSAAAQLRALQGELGEDSGAIDMYLSVLEGFLQETEPARSGITNRTVTPAKP